MTATLPWLEPALASLRCASGHAWLLHGALGNGLWPLAERAAHTWLCEHPDIERRPCGECAGCHLLAAGTHPDLRVLMPEAMQAELGLALPSMDGAEASKAKPSKEIKVGAVRAAIDWAHTSSARGRGKVVVIVPADAMNLIAASAWLKTLEEPPPGVRLLLACEALENLVPTLRSRCQQLHLATPAPQQAAAWLAAQKLAGAQTLLAAAGGEPLTAQRWPELGLPAERWAGLPAAVAGQGGDTAALATLAPAVLVDLLLRLAHDALAVSAGAAPRYTPGGWPAAPTAAAQAGHIRRLAAWCEALRRVASHADHPWHAPLLADTLLMQARQALAPLWRRAAA